MFHTDIKGSYSLTVKLSPSTDENAIQCRGINSEWVVSGETQKVNAVNPPALHIKDSLNSNEDISLYKYEEFVRRGEYLRPTEAILKQQS